MAEEVKTKHALLSTTQIAGALGSAVLIWNLYSRLSGKSEISVSTQELAAIADILTPLACTVWMMWRRFQPKTPLRLKVKEK